MCALGRCRSAAVFRVQAEAPSRLAGTERVFTAGSVAGLSAQRRCDARSCWCSGLVSLGSIRCVSGAGGGGARGCLYLLDHGPTRSYASGTLCCIFAHV